MSATATGLFQYDDGEDLVEGSVLAHGATPEAAQAAARAEMARLAPTLVGFSVSEVLPGNPFGIPE